MKPKLIKQGDTVEVLPGYIFPSIVYCQGVVQQSLDSRLAIVKLPSIQRCATTELMELFTSADWIVPWSKLKVIESAYDDSVGDLEEKVFNLESDLSVVRACLSISEQLRERQKEIIDRLLKDISSLSKGDKP